MRTIGHYRPVLEPLLKVMARKSHFECDAGFAKILGENPRLIAVFSHATPISWLPVMAMICKETCDAGGADRIPLGIMDRFFYDFAPLRFLAKLVAQSEKPVAFEDLEAHLRSFERADLCVFPEGSNCFFGDPREIQEFRSPRILELSIRSRIPVMVGVHRGSEIWGQVVKLHTFAPLVAAYLPSALSHRAETLERIVVPLLPQKMDEFAMKVELYHPKLLESELSTDRVELRAQLEQEASRLRGRMVEMLAELDGRSGR